MIIITLADSVSAAGSTSSNASSMKSFDGCFFFQDSACQKAEIMCELKHNELSNNYSKNLIDLFKIMFPDSKIAEKMQLKPIRLKYVVNQGLAPCVKEILKKPDHRHCLVCYII